MSRHYHVVLGLSISEARDLLQYASTDDPLTDVQDRRMDDVVVRLELALAVARVRKYAREANVRPVPARYEVEAWLARLGPGERIVYRKDGTRIVVDEAGDVLRVST